MGINKFNHEGYHDPTPHEALTNIMKKEKAAIAGWIENGKTKISPGRIFAPV